MSKRRKNFVLYPALILFAIVLGVTIVYLLYWVFLWAYDWLVWGKEPEFWQFVIIILIFVAFLRPETSVIRERDSSRRRDTAA